MKTYFQWTEEQVAWLIEFWPQLGTIECARILQIPREKIYPKCSRLGLKLNENVKSMKCSYTTMNQSKFFDFNDPKICYIFGMLWADGHVDIKRNTISLNLVTEDMNEVYHNLQSMGTWSKNIITSDIRRQQTRLRFKSKLMTQFLIDHDYKAKSHMSADKILHKIPEVNHYAWWLGYFDGDGSISIHSKGNNINFTSSYEQDWSFAESLFQKLDISYTKYQYIHKSTQNKLSRILINRVVDSRTFLSFIYQNPNLIVLTRKYDKYIH